MHLLRSTWLLYEKLDLDFKKVKVKESSNHASMKKLINRLVVFFCYTSVTIVLLWLILKYISFLVYILSFEANLRTVWRRAASLPTSIITCLPKRIYKKFFFLLIVKWIQSSIYALQVPFSTTNQQCKNAKSATLKFSFLFINSTLMNTLMYCVT